jgi:Flp pilus assembly protein TadD
LSDETTVSCSVCGHANPPDATVCGACGFVLNNMSAEEKVDAILEDLLDLSKAPLAEAKPETPPAPDESEVDETEAEELFDSLLVEIQPSPPSESAQPAGAASAPVVEEARPSAAAAAEAEPIPVIATPAETESGKMIRISGRMFDGVTYASVGVLVAVFLVFRMYINPFDFSAPLPILLFGAVAAGGMIAALVLFRISNSAVAHGDRLVKQGRYQEALAHYERAIRLLRRPSYAWTSRGVAMRYLGRLDEALRCHENAIRLDPENEVAWCNLGTVYFKKGLLGKALDCYDRAIKIRPRYAIAWNNKGVVYARMNRFEDADKCHAKATKLRPEYVAAWLNRGEVLARLGASEEAQKCLERARSISRGSAA